MLDRTKRPGLSSGTMQRLRFRFSRGEELKYISHLDLMRLWSRALRRAGLPVAYSEGFSPHPKISLAAPLPIGVTSEAELMDITLWKPVSPHFAMKSLVPRLPRGIDLVEIEEASLAGASLQSQVRYAEYRVVVETADTEAKIGSAIEELLQADTLPWQHMRDTGPRQYDLRPLVSDVWLLDHNGPYATLGMRLRCDSQGTGRPEQVSVALGFPTYPVSIHRTALVLARK